MAELKRSILVVDDEAATRSLLREILEHAGFQVVEAADGIIALGVLEKRPIDLVITDRSMPGLGGLELLVKIRDQRIEVPVLMMSAYGEESLWGKAIALGAVDYLLKPFTAAEVLKGVHKALKGTKKT